MKVDCLFLPKAAPFSSYLLLVPFLLKDAPLFIYLLLFPSSYFHQNFQPRPLPTKRIRVQLKNYALMTLFHWSFSSQSRLGFFLEISTLFSALFILTNPLDKCETKIFEDMNILIILFYL